MLEPKNNSTIEAQTSLGSKGYDPREVHCDSLKAGVTWISFWRFWDDSFDLLMANLQRHCSDYSRSLRIEEMIWNELIKLQFLNGFDSFYHCHSTACLRTTRPRQHCKMIPFSSNKSRYHDLFSKVDDRVSVFFETCFSHISPVFLLRCGWPCHLEGPWCGEAETSGSRGG